MDIVKLYLKDLVSGGSKEKGPCHFSGFHKHFTGFRWRDDDTPITLHCWIPALLATLIGHLISHFTSSWVAAIFYYLAWLSASGEMLLGYLSRARQWNTSMVDLPWRQVWVWVLVLWTLPWWPVWAVSAIRFWLAQKWLRSTD